MARPSRCRRRRLRARSSQRPMEHLWPRKRHAERSGRATLESMNGAPVSPCSPIVIDRGTVGASSIILIVLFHDEHCSVYESKVCVRCKSTDSRSALKSIYLSVCNLCMLVRHFTFDEHARCVKDGLAGLTLRDVAGRADAVAESVMILMAGTDRLLVRQKAHHTPSSHMIQHTLG